MGKYTTELDDRGLKIELKKYRLPRRAALGDTFMWDGTFTWTECHLVTFKIPMDDMHSARIFDMEPMAAIQLHRWLTEHIDELVTLAQKAKRGKA